jgi:hypothetical protein
LLKSHFFTFRFLSLAIRDLEKISNARRFERNIRDYTQVCHARLGILWSAVDRFRESCRRKRHSVRTRSRSAMHFVLHGGNWDFAASASRLMAQFTLFPTDSENLPDSVTAHHRTALQRSRNIRQKPRGIKWEISLPFRTRQPHGTMRIKMNESFKEHISSPDLIAGWSGMGNVGLRAVNYMRSSMGAREFARIDMSDELMPEAIGVKDGLIMRPDLPVTRLFYASQPPVIFVEGEEQLHGQAALALMRGVLDLAHESKVRTIYTAAAFAMPVSCAHDPLIFGAANDILLRDRLGPMGVTLLKDGHVSGMNGALLGLANDYQIPAACLMSTMPQYALRLPNPKSSREIIRFFERVLDYTVNMTGLNKGVLEMDVIMGDIEKRILEAMSKLTGEQDTGIQREQTPREEKKSKTPEGAMLRIEQLFEELSLNKSKKKAARLKEELDRWNLYDLYEDRFLDLFKNGSDGTE